MNCFRKVAGRVRVERVDDRGNNVQTPFRRRRLLIHRPEIMAPCIKCRLQHSTPQHFLLTCWRCKRSWHNDCYEPNVTSKEITARINGTVNGDPDYNVSTWLCVRCSKRPALSSSSVPVPFQSSSVKREPAIVQKTDEKPIQDHEISHSQRLEEPVDTSSDSEIEVIEYKQTTQFAERPRSRRVEKQETTTQVRGSSSPKNADPGDTSSESDGEIIKREGGTDKAVRRPGLQNMKKTAVKQPTSEIVVLDDDSDSGSEPALSLPASVPPETTAPSRSVSMGLTDNEVDQLINNGLGEDSVRPEPSSESVPSTPSRKYSAP
ncbi:hypothetical protein K435DRAFT_117208 [Dendrothele bispora CBS 962.96]|uniref:Zinc finger PHD-type domain-containing protein n=1 Tax=Dendrothele bispora (strain CBS 962.96) TaxID=1314807 RepID=A0A4S8MQI7_DENBC|nr:hypothetical protein K435DRAFT_117208 [Dendrothele bispora CBS 962.96]